MLQPNRFYVLSMSCCLLAFESSGCVSSAVQTLPNADGVLEKRVSYAGLDLDSSTGAEVLLRRLKAAAGQVCEPFDGERLEQKYRWHECYERALTNAIREVNHPQVTMLYEASEKKPMFPATVGIELHSPRALRVEAVWIGCSVLNRPLRLVRLGLCPRGALPP